MSNTAASRILIISPAKERALHLVNLLATDAKPTSSNLDSDRIIPWTISNKYYTADVHFEIREVAEWNSDLVHDVPAVIFVWASGESYRKHVQVMSEELITYDVEVSLAVRIEDSTHPEHADGDEDTDEFLATHGFEFVQARPNAVDNISQADGNFSDGIPGLTRVIDALSTIMWPTMVQSSNVNNRKSRARELLDWAKEEEEDDGLRALVGSSSDHIDVPSTTRLNGEKKSRMQREMEELERWLQEDEAIIAHQDPWVIDPHSSQTRNSQTSASPTSPNAEVSGFEDDFTVFVSAPAQVASGQSSPTVSSDTEHLTPVHAGASYRSLGSVSDFGDDAEKDDTDADPDLPSRAEIEATTARIFGSSSTSPLPALSRQDTARPFDSPSLFQMSNLPPSADSSFDALDVHYDDDDDDDDYDIGAFDLSRVLSALQNMKAEIAGLEDEGERRRAAARVALGLVYGLERGERNADSDAPAGSADVPSNG